jgi:TolA-binding protein
VKPACPRLFEAESLRDGRLTGAEVTRFQAHLGVCPVCAREVRALEALGVALRAATHSGTQAGADELRVRRERTRLLAAFDASLVPPARHRGPAWRLGLALLAVLTFLAAFVGLGRLAPRELEVTSTRDPVEVRPGEAARWSRSAELRRERIVLAQGTLSIRVDRAVSQRSVLVVLPDGELEDIGTTFSVTVDAGRTTRVRVDEGSVVLRLNGQAPRTVGAGDAWAANPEPAPAAASSSAASQPALTAAPARPSAARSAPLASAAAVDPSADFRDALSALHAGRAAEAAGRFASFLARHPRDTRAEDAAYLRFLALQRSGDANAARAAARDYVRRFPRGFRRTEVEPFSR